MKNTLNSVVPTLVALLVAGVGTTQVPFSVDTTFRTIILSRNVNDIHLLEDGKIYLSGQIRFPGDPVSFRGSARLLPNGQQDLSFPQFPQTTGAGKIVPWVDGQFYVSNGLVRRMLPDGLIDPSFIMMNNGIYFQSFVNGDYHVYPDGRVLMSGKHTLSDSARGFVGNYNLIWFSNTGYLDTTRTHRQGNGSIYRFAELPDGKFICNGTGSTFEGLPVDRIFRVHADGAPDTTFNTGVYIGSAFAYLPLPDGRVYVGGNYESSQAPGDTLRLARFMPDGSLDPTFSIPQFDDGTLNWYFGASVTNLHPWSNGRFIATGSFQYVNGLPRRGLCMLDSTGQLLDVFDDCGVGPFTYQNYNYGSIAAIAIDTANNHMYLCGAYLGYNDGLTNDPLQRFVSRLHLGDIVTDVGQQVQRAENNFTAHPNPASSYVVLSHRVPNNKSTLQLVVRDLSGRQLKQLSTSGEEGQTVWDTRGITPGVYTVEWQQNGRMLETLRIVIQP